MLKAEQDLIAELDMTHQQVCASERRFLFLLIRAETEHVWRNEGARDLAHWVSIRYGVSAWKAHRWIAAAHALEELPGISAALATGELGLDKVVELTRFATPSTEVGLIRWARTVSPAAVRRRADREVRTSTQAEIDAHEARFLSWWYLDEGSRVGLEAELPAAQGAVVVKAIERMVERVPEMPGEEHAWSLPARRADALMALCSARLAADPDPDRATVIVHTKLETLASEPAESETADAAPHRLVSAQIEGGSVIHPETVRRLLCNARVQTVVENGSSDVVGLGSVHREPPAWMARQIRYRDRECRFPGCGARAFTQAHHLRFWRHGGRTELENLILLCSFHHRLVHELGWIVRRRSDGTYRWQRPDGTRYRAGPSPRVVPNDRPAIRAIGSESQHAPT
jgi:hypothetical protein